jgi:hypothetical protein
MRFCDWRDLFIRRRRRRHRHRAQSLLSSSMLLVAVAVRCLSSALADLLISICTIARLSPSTGAMIVWHYCIFVIAIMT